MPSAEPKHLVFISPQFSRKEASSHVFWFVGSLEAAAESANVRFSRVLPADESALATVSLHHSALQRRRLTLFPWLHVSGDATNISRIAGNQKEETVLFHVYDGGFRELLLVCKLLKKISWAHASINLTLVEPWVKVFSSPGFHSHLLRFAMKGLLTYFGGRLKLYTDTEELGRVLFTDQVEFREYPLFSFLNEPTKKAHGAEQRNLLLAAPSNSFELDMLLNAIAQVEQDVERKVMVILKWGFSASNQQLQKMADLNVEVLPTQLSSSDYESLLSQARIYVLPYLNRNYFKYQSSGRLLDGAVFGVQMLVPNDTTLARKVLQESWGACFAGSDSESLSRAIEALWVKARFEGNQPISPRSAVESLFEYSFGGSTPFKRGALKLSVLYRILSCMPFFLGPRFLAGAFLSFLGISPRLLKRISHVLSRPRET